MYTGPNMAPQTGNAVARGTVPVIAAVCCAATLLLLLAATIVLALIPLYIPQKTLSRVSTKSSQVTTLIPLASSGRRRQAGSDVGSAVGGSITDDAQLTDMKNKVKESLKGSKDVKDVESMQADIVSVATSRRRRLAISKRATGKTYLRLKYIIVFAENVVTVAQQAAKGDSIRSVFQTNTAVLAIFVFDNLVVTVNGQKVGFKCKADGLPIVSQIRGGNDVAAAAAADAGLPATIPPALATSGSTSASTGPASAGTTSAAPTPQPSG